MDIRMSEFELKRLIQLKEQYEVLFNLTKEEKKLLIKLSKEYFDDYDLSNFSIENVIDYYISDTKDQYIKLKYVIDFWTSSEENIDWETCIAMKQLLLIINNDNIIFDEIRSFCNTKISYDKEVSKFNFKYWFHSTTDVFCEYFVVNNLFDILEKRDMLKFYGEMSPNKKFEILEKISS